MPSNRSDLDEGERRDAIEELEKAAALTGGYKELAEKIGYHRDSAWRWRNTGKVPALAAKRIDDVTDDLISKSKLRPDLWPPVESPEDENLFDAVSYLVEQGITAEEFESMAKRVQS